jgi:hypothetical protein
MLIAKIVDSKVKPLYRFGVKERTDQFFNIYRLKKKEEALKKASFF